MPDLLDKLSESEGQILTAGLVGSAVPDPRDLDALEAAGGGVRPTPAATGPPAARTEWAREIFIEARTAGVSAAVIWDSTIRKLIREMVVAYRRNADRVQRDKALAYYTAMLARTEKLPPMERWLHVPRRRQTMADQRVVIDQLSAQLGIPLRVTRLVRRGRGSPWRVIA